ncbi:MAG: eukaryotic-like serine/threonine-protein kinase [Myxococcales bacterium]|jgi:serine/threonine protein kinase|nr:eukaryotic-like serine/threonine-protein kinase [Myxococcales bacterium]
MIDVGQTIGNYKITAKLGEGGMGVVYLAEHPVIGKKVAMKAIHPELARNAEVVSRFVTEAKSVNQIGHEHIVDISDFGNTTDGEFYFVMEYLQGESMSERLKREERLTVPSAVNIATQVADALGSSHEHGIIHRDLKPENIYLISRGAQKDFVKVLDFGLAKLTQVEEKVTHKTRTGSVMGTPYYMSPEQCEGKATIDHRADIYSLGVILFEMLTGKVPFGGEGYGEIIVKHITMPPPSVRSIVPNLSPALDLILFRALAKDREERFQTMADFREALRDPDAYAPSAPLVGIPDDLSGAARAAAPMKRSDINLAAKVGFGSGLRMGSGGPDDPVTSPSTYRQGVGEIIEELTPRRTSRKALLFVALAGLTGLSLFALTGRRETRHPAAPPVAEAPRVPTAVRVNFNSDPDRATVYRTDTGQELGTTPLSIEVPYSDSAVEFVFKKSGFENKVMYIVPNLPSPLFATLQPTPKPGKSETPGTLRALAPAGPGGKASRRRPGAPAHRDKLDDDAVLEPSIQ